MKKIKIATWNVNSIKVRLPQVLDWLSKKNIDILALQETKTIDEQFPIEAIQQAGYQVIFSGQKAYNGVAILSREPLAEVMTDIPTLADPQRRILITTIGKLRIVNLYVPNGQSVDSEKYAYKLHWLREVTAFIQQTIKDYEYVCILGDFNIAPENRDVHDPKAWEGHVLVSKKEREAFEQLLHLGVHDSFRLFDQAEQQYSWWDYRTVAFRRNAGLRIDHILISDALKTHCQACYIDKEPRSLERPSDHAPVIAELLTVYSH